MKLDELLFDLRNGEHFGATSGCVYTVEFQKRGLPHAHIILWLANRSAMSTPDEIDEFISAELPNPVGDPEAYRIVSQFMVHGPCGHMRPTSPCMKDGSCTKYFSKDFHDRTIVGEDGFIVYKRRNTEITVKKNGLLLDNRYVVPYNLYLLLKYQAHINVERCYSTKLIKYLFKYICKGRDRALVSIQRLNLGSVHGQRTQQDGLINEVLDYLDCRYLSPPEAVWRLFQYPTHVNKPSIERLPVHLPMENSIVFSDLQQLADLANTERLKRTKLTAWFELNSIDPLA